MWRIVIASLVLAGSAHAATATRAETLTEALSHAYAYNPELIAARAGQRATDEQVPQALAGWRPTVTVTGTGARSTVNAASSIPGFSYRQFSQGATLQVQQPLYQGGRTSSDVKRAEDTVRAGRADLLGTEQNVLLSAARAYQDILRSRALLDLNREVELVLQRQVRDITIRMQAGQLTITDVNQASTKLASAAAARIGSEGDVATALANFRAAVGRPPQGRLAQPTPPPGLPTNGSDAVRLAEDNNPTVLASLFRSRAAENAIAVARADLLPNVNVTVLAGRDNGVTYPNIRSNSYSATLNLSVPIYQGGAVDSRVRQAKESAAQSRTQIQVTRRDAIENATSAYAQWRASIDQAAQQAVQVRLATMAYDNVTREAALGAKSTFELLGQLQDLYNARLNLVNANFNVAVNAYQLLVAVGRFTAADLKLPVTLYDPIVNYDRVRDKGALLP